MPVLIDGHNLIAQMPNMSLADPDDEAQLVMLLRRYVTRKRGGRVIVVFDHGVYGHPTRLNGYGVECHFARSPRDADQELIRRIRAIKRPGNWLVVSSDKAVTSEARARGMRVSSSHAFGQKLLHLNQPTAAAPSASEQTERSLSEAEVQEWLRLFGVDDDEEA